MFIHREWGKMFNKSIWYFAFKVISTADQLSDRSPDSSRQREARLRHTLPCGTDTLGRHSMLHLGSFNFSGLVIPALKGLWTSAISSLFPLQGEWVGLGWVEQVYSRCFLYVTHQALEIPAFPLDRWGNKGESSSVTVADAIIGSNPSFSLIVLWIFTLSGPRSTCSVFPLPGLWVSSSDLIWPVKY